MTELLQIIDAENIELIEKDMVGRNKGFYIDNVIFIDKKMTFVNKRCKLSEELGHHFTTVGDITNQTESENRKQERIARKWGYHKILSLNDLAKALNHSCQTIEELSEYLRVTEDYLSEALQYYKERYGLYVKLKEHIVCFEPLRVLRNWQELEEWHT